MNTKKIGMFIEDNNYIVHEYETNGMPGEVLKTFEDENEAIAFLLEHQLPIADIDAWVWNIPQATEE